ncbi:lysophospholipid acyltransferase family protein [Noviherbaspirillum galbum]|uniref:1-acyl-sn-glycerol-3-phosphate acyltransferase n=1 Tax=Noviherbaspirillum galbum TaxID=2709383 RepID=A0A6B3SJC0_9BURK|nr:lysophospholipid acyltransferase family protein [Noviherbaspirillum galbum]NEX60823.1 1-acyl-sn-glycerol-3-phosphate acyltransferase [Noviherbaspirillum galbum]
MSHPILFLRSLAFTLTMIVATVIWAPICFLFAPLPYEKRYFMTGLWNRFIIGSLRVFCGVRHQIKGAENLPDCPAIVLSKHQSAWETIFLYYALPRPLVYVFKKELLYIPFFGWGIALLRMIPIDRSKTKDAFAQVVEQGKQRLATGKWIIMFPEGTRSKVGKQGKYKSGGTRLAVETKVPVIPIALNAGECWPKNSFIKKPGLITVSIGKPISSAGRTPNDLMQEVENWIESEMRVISSPGVYTQTYVPNKTLEAASPDSA